MGAEKLGALDSKSGVWEGPVTAGGEMIRKAEVWGLGLLCLAQPELLVSFAALDFKELALEDLTCSWFSRVGSQTSHPTLWGMQYRFSPCLSSQLFFPFPK